MRRARLLPWLFLLLSAATPPAVWGAGDNVFSGQQVHTIDLHFAQPAYWDSLKVYYSAGDEQFMVATVTVDGVAYDSVGVRLKGNASYNHPNDKKPFRLSFDEYRDAQRWDGLKSVHLNNCWEDPTFLREKLQLDFLNAAGIAAPRGNFAQLSINDTLWGFYSLVEHVDKTFLSARFGNKEGQLYKAVDGFITPLISDFKWYGSDTSLYVNRYELKNEDAPARWTDLITVIDSLNNSSDVAAALPAVVELSGVYRVLAADNLWGNLDSYAGSGRNFYSYFDESTGKMRWVVWDVGLSLGGYWGAVTNYETLGLNYVSNATNRPLAGKIFNDATLDAAYLQSYCSLYNRYFSATKLSAKLDTLAALVRSYVAADPRKMYTDAQFEANLTSDLTVGGHRKPGLKSFLTARAASVESQLSALGVTCPATVLPGDLAINEFAADNAAIIDPTTGLASDWVELYNNTSQSVTLDGMYLSDNASKPTKWQFPAGTTIAGHGYLIVWADNGAAAGLHASWALSKSGEHVRLSYSDASVLDSVTFGTQTTDRTMARIPNGTGTFVVGAPTFGVNNDGSHAIATGTVVVNEFMADNTAILDPAGEAEDWIELANTTAAAIDLGGLYLSDDVTTPTKWQFPSGTQIAAAGYLVVWADEDLTQDGLHAAFKLSKSGEAVVLSNPDLAIVDSTTFGAQTTDVSTARYPDGTGAFVHTVVATPGASNVYSTAVPNVLTVHTGLGRIAPNPLHGGATISWSIATQGHARLQVFDLQGRLVATLADGEMKPGEHRVVFDACGLRPGLYLCRLHAGEVTAARKLVVVE
jgi:hypothetical protein